MRIGWFDASAGASGDMLLGALVSAGVPIEVPARAIGSLGVGIELRAREVHRCGLGALKVDVECPEAHVTRNLDDVVALFGPLDDEVASLATSIFTRLAEAEAAVHRAPVEQVHFHEVGALDSIADVVGAAACLVHLDLDTVACSALSLGRGTVRAAHGLLPVPTPAVLELLGSHVPVQAGPAPFESTTPTGAAVLTTVAQAWGPLPSMSVDGVGVGAGSRDSDEVPNVLRFVHGTAV